jgi:hypothetical protein
MMKRSPFRFAAVAVLGLLAASCTSDKKIQYCPAWTSVLDAVVVTQFKPGAAPDPANALYTAKITNVDGSCTFDKQGKTADSDIDVTFTATRPAAGDEATYSVPYFVAVTQGTRIITRTMRSVTFTFDAGETTATAEEDVNDIALVTDGTNKPYNYQILVGFQLTKEQYDYNKTTGIFQQ